MVLRRFSKGFSIIEAVVGAALFVFFATAFVGAWRYGLRGTTSANNRSQAILFAEEGLEAVRSMRDGGFSNLIDGVHGIAFDSGKWQWSGVSDTNGIFSRTINITTIDNQTKQVSSTVGWSDRGEPLKYYYLAAYLTNWMKPTVGDWSRPWLSGSYNASGNVDGKRLAKFGDFLFLSRASGSSNILVFDISSVDSPALITSFSAAGNINDMKISGDYLFVASSDNSKELQIFKISNPFSPYLIGSFNTSGSMDALAIAMVENKVFLARVYGLLWDNLDIIDVSDPSKPRLIGSSYYLADLNDIWISGNYAYIATSNALGSVVVVDISDPSSPKLASDFYFWGLGKSLSIAGIGNTIFLGMSNGKIAVVDISNPSSPRSLALFSLVSGNISSLAISSDGGFLFVGAYDNKKSFAVIDISDPAHPSLFGYLGLKTNLNDVIYDSEADRVFAAAIDNKKELLVVAPN